MIDSIILKFLQLNFQLPLYLMGSIIKNSIINLNQWHHVVVFFGCSINESKFQNILFNTSTSWSRIEILKFVRVCNKHLYLAHLTLKHDSTVIIVRNHHFFDEWKFRSTPDIRNHNHPKIKWEECSYIIYSESNAHDIPFSSEYSVVDVDKIMAM